MVPGLEFLRISIYPSDFEAYLPVYKIKTENVLEGLYSENLLGAS
jgi:hypothetical protein